MPGSKKGGKAVVTFFGATIAIARSARIAAGTTWVMVLYPEPRQRRPRTEARPGERDFCSKAKREVNFR